jgi:protein dithiol oxidoreductase (disulfide-forming)
MLRNFITALALLAAVNVAFAQAAYVEGRDFYRLKAQQPVQVAKPKVEVLEIFQYGCIHCAHMESTLAVWKKTISPSIGLRAVHVSYPNSGMQNLARAHLALQALGVVEKANPIMFKDVESGQQPNTDLAKIAPRFAAIGIKAETFLATANSFAVSQKLKQNEAILPRYEFGGTPEFIVAGKYRVSIERGQTQEYALKVVDYLVQKELLERAAMVKK